jgi:hypothetical protein
MLYMVIANHNAESCPIQNQAVCKKAVAKYKNVDKVAKKLKITPKGSWAYMPGHLIYMVCDAPNTHVVS